MTTTSETFLSTECDTGNHNDCLRYALRTPQTTEDYDPTQLTKCGCDCHGGSLRTVMVYGCEYVYVVDPDDEEIGDPDSEQSQELARYVEEAIREGLENGIRIHSVPKAKWSFVFIPRPRPHRMLHVVYTAEEYQTEGSRTVGHFHTRQDLLMFAQNGMTGELGEFANHLSKTYFQGHPYNREGMIEELGDLLWFACRAMDAMDVSIMDVMNINLKKLRKRYANGAFSTKASIARIDVETHQGRKPE